MKLRRIIALALAMLLCTSLMAPMASATEGQPKQEPIDLTAAAVERSNGTWDVTYTAKLTLSADNAEIYARMMSVNPSKYTQLSFICELSDNVFQNLTLSNVNFTISDKSVFTDVKAEQNNLTKNIVITCKLTGDDWGSLDKDAIKARLNGHTLTFRGTQTGVDASLVAGSISTEARVRVLFNETEIFASTNSSNNGPAAYGKTESMRKTHYSSGSGSSTPSSGAIDVVQTDGKTGDVTHTPVGSSYSNVGAVVTVTAANNSGAAPRAGSHANVTVQTNPGKVITNVVIKDANGNIIPVTYSGDGVYDFVMPSGSVTVGVEYENAPFTPEESGATSMLNTDEHIAYTKGENDGKWHPRDYVTRAQVSMMFYRLLRNQNVETNVSFTDVKDSSWYADAVKTLAALGIIKGFADGSFHPNDYITRAEFVALSTRFAVNAPDAKKGVLFGDVLDTHWAHDSIAKAEALGWIIGYPSGYFRPNDNINRAEAVTAINRILGRPGDLAAMKAGKGVSLSDVPETFWGYSAITESATPHDFSFDKSINTETWVNN